MKVIICEDPWKEYFLGHDTGFGNRLIYWGLAYELMLKLGRDWSIGVYADKYPELKYLRFPKTHIIEKKPLNKDIEIIKLKKLNSILKENYKPKKETISLEYEYNFNISGYDYHLGQHLPKINLKDKILVKRIKEFVSELYTVHIRRGNGIYTTLENIFSIPKKYQKYYIPENNSNFIKNKKGIWELSDAINTTYKFPLDKDIYKVLKTFPSDEKFYISTDMPEAAVGYYKTKFKNRIFLASDFLKANKIKPLVKGKDTFLNILDFFMLVYSKGIICSKASQWSDTASYVNLNKRIYY